MYYRCEKCGWVGKRTGTMGAGVISIKICPKCPGISNVKPIGFVRPKAIETTEILNGVEAE